jgi:peroxiredoxin
MDFDVVDLGEADHPAVGETAPDFTRPLVNDEYWEDVALSSLTDEGPVLLVFHPMDGAWPALYLWRDLAERAPEESVADLSVVGVSVSTPYAHRQFIRDRDLPYRLFSDPSNAVAREYGVDHDLDGMTGVEEPRPALFLLDGDRTVVYAWVAREHPEFPDFDELDDALAALD